MRKSKIFHFGKLRVLGSVARLLLGSLGLTIGAHGEYIEPTEAVLLWREWMSEIQREPSLVSTPRIYIMTDREVLQTGPDTAKFQNGRYRMVVADGGVPDIDSDYDAYTDVFEDGNPFAWRDDPELIPRDGMGNPLPIDANIGVLLANGQLLGLATSTLGSGSKAITVRPKTGANVRVVGAPSSGFQRPAALQDYSTEFFYYTQFPGQTIGAYQQFPLSLYHLRKDYPNPQDGNSLETTLVPGVYQVEYPTIVNAPTGKGYVSVAHKLVPNGSLTVGLKRPSWLIRSLSSAESSVKPPVMKTWVNGRLKFDPYLPATLTWDNIAASGLATNMDYIDLYLEDEEGFQISYYYRVNATTSTLSFDNSSPMKLIYGDFVSFLGRTSPPLSVNGNIVMTYRRYGNGQSAADLSSVTVRVPIQMTVSYPSWRREWFPSDVLVDSISGPNADPDGDGLTNQQEFDQGTNPTVPALLVTNPTSTDIAANSATLGGTVVTDPSSTTPVTIYESGVVYSASSINSSPAIDGNGVIRVVAPSPLPFDNVFTVGVTGLAPNTQYSFRAYAITSLGLKYSTPVSTFKTTTLPLVTLPTVTSPTSSIVLAGFPATISANLGGNVTSDGGSTITERGVVYSVTSNNDNPFIGGAGVTKVTGTGTTGTFTVNVAGVQSATTYSFRAYAINAVGTSYTSTIGTFTTFSGPTITSPTHTNVTSSSAKLGGNVTNSGGSAVLQRGVVFSLTSVNSNPVMGGNGVSAFSASSSGTGVFTVNATGLLPGRQYSYKAFAINAVTTAYTSVGTFTTTGTLATVSSPTISSITSTSATLGANVTSDGSSAIVERGFVYAPTAVDSNPNEGDPGVTKVTVAGTTGVYATTLTGLLGNTGYTFKAFVRNGVGIAYGSPYAFFTTFPPLTVNSPTVADVTATTATLGGTVVSDGGTSASERGVVVSLDPNVAPAIGGPGVIKFTGSGTMGVFTVAVTGLQPDSDYYFRAYATNTSGASYSDTASFRTLQIQLLGQSEVQWTSSQEEMLQIQAEGEEESQSIQPQTVPEFVYLKHPSEANDPLDYQIEVSTDASLWQPIDENQWLVEESSESISATWSSANSPPARIFFRVRGTPE